MRKKHNLLIGERTAEDIKIKVGTCYPRAEVERMNVRGRNLADRTSEDSGGDLRGLRGGSPRDDDADCGGGSQCAGKDSA